MSAVTFNFVKYNLYNQILSLTIPTAELVIIIRLAGPSGHHCRCYGVVDVSVQSVFWCSQCTGEVDI